LFNKNVVDGAEDVLVKAELAAVTATSSGWSVTYRTRGKYTV